MRIAVLPFNAGPGTRPELARQLANYLVEIVQGNTESQIDAANYMAQVEEQGIPRFALINPSESLNDPEILGQFRQQAQFDRMIDGLFTETGDSGSITIRVWAEDPQTPLAQEDFTYLPGGIFGALRSAIEFVLKIAGGELHADLQEDENLFGTKDSAAFLKFLQGYDALKFIEQAQGQIVSTWDVKPYMDLLQEAIAADKDWEAPFLIQVQLCRICTQFRVGDARAIEETIKGLTAQEPDDSRAWFAMGEFYETVGNAQGSSDAYEKAAQLAPEEPAILHRLARMQLALGMPVNAERNLRKATEMEDDEKPSLDLLSEVLAQTGRGHEVPELWNDLIRKNEQNAKAHARYAMSLLATGREQEGVRAFDRALEVLEDNTIIKRYYAPYLAQKEDELDRAMDFYEDCIDVAPTDQQLLWEYAQTLARANREFEVPDVLRQLLATQPDPNLAANANAWLIEIEQPKRVEAVKGASEKADAGDFEGSVADLRPMRQWLGDYWKMWLLLASGQNKLEEFEEAEQSARRLLEMFPACEPGYVELSNALGGQGKHDEAMQLMQIALGNMPGSLPIAVGYAAAAKRAGHGDEARRITGQIRQAMQEQGVDPAQVGDLVEALDKIDA
ncbi:MAG: hypothetical protein LCH41_13025 [Armatimonadetes bacterium]|nr:hypothetical protein [Armatimonadota bacterium]